MRWMSLTHFLFQQKWFWHHSSFHVLSWRSVMYTWWEVHTGYRMRVIDARWQPTPTDSGHSPLASSTQDSSSFQVSQKNKKRDYFDSFYFSPGGWLDTCQCQVTDAKVMTFTAAKCGHNLPQTSLLLGKVIPTSNQKKNLATPPGLRRPMHGPNSKLTGWQLILEVCFTHWPGANFFTIRNGLHSGVEKRGYGYRVKKTRIYVHLQLQSTSSSRRVLRSRP